MPCWAPLRWLTPRSEASPASKPGRPNLSNLPRVTPGTQSRLGQHANYRIDRYAARGDSILRRWVDVGRAEEQLQPLLTQDTTTDCVEVTLDYLARSPEMDELMGEQSFDLVGEMIEGVQERSSNTTIVFREWFYTTVLRRPSSRSITTGMSSAPPKTGSLGDRTGRN
jgi:hypothetical protein